MHTRFLAVLLLLSCSVWAQPQLSDELKVFTRYLGTWEADFPAAKGKPAMQDVARWERALNGTAVRTLHSINKGMYGGESLIFWDNSKASLVFFYFTTAGFYTQGTMEVISPTEFVAYEEVHNSKEGITKVKSTSKFANGEFLVSTQYLKNGSWTTATTRRYRASQKKVQFK